MSVALSDDEIEDRFFLQGRMEILNALNDLIHRGEPVTIYFDGGRDFILTMLLEARPEALIFDLGGDDAANKRLAGSASCTFIATPDGVRVQFSGAQPKRFSWGGTDAFWVPLPARIVRLQRRENFRGRLPMSVKVKVKSFSETGVKLEDWSLHDLSVGGFAVSAAATSRLAVGQHLHCLKMNLDKSTEIECAGIVRHVTKIADRNGKAGYRIGVAFFELERRMEISIQRYIIHLEHERRKLLLA